MVLADVEHTAPSAIVSVGVLQAWGAIPKSSARNRNAKVVSGVMSAIHYRCPDCEQKITFVAQQTADDGDFYESTLCPNCRELHSVNRTTGQVLAEDELGDPW
jgi:hypothetical protein